MDFAQTASSCREFVTAGSFDEAASLGERAYNWFLEQPVEDQYDVVIPMAEVLLCRAEALWRMGKRQEGVDVVGLVCRLDSASVDFALKSATFLRKAKQFRLAVPYIQRCMELDPRNVRARTMMRSVQAEIRLAAEGASPPADTAAVLHEPSLPPLPTRATGSDGDGAALSSPPVVPWWNSDDGIDSNLISSVGSFSVPLSRMEPRQQQQLYTPFRSPPFVASVPSDVASFGGGSVSASNTSVVALKPSSLSFSSPERTSVEQPPPCSTTPYTDTSKSPAATLLGGAGLQQLSSSPDVVQPRVLQRQSASSAALRNSSSFASSSSSALVAAPRLPAQVISVGVQTEPVRFEGPQGGGKLSDVVVGGTSVTTTARTPSIITMRWRRVAMAVVLVALLHNLLEGTARPVFRVVGVPLSVLSFVILLAAVK